MALTNSLVVLFIAVLLQIFWRNFNSNASCFSLLWLYLGITWAIVRWAFIGPLVLLCLWYSVNNHQKIELFNISLLIVQMIFVNKYLFFSSFISCFSPLFFIDKFDLHKHGASSRIFLSLFHWNKMISDITYRTKTHLFSHIKNVKESCIVVSLKAFIKTNEPRCEKTGFQGFRPGPTQTGLYSHRR